MDNLENFMSRVISREQSSREGFTAITKTEVVKDLIYYHDLTAPDETDDLYHQQDLNLLAMLEEGYELMWGGDEPTLYINGDRRTLYGE